MTYFEQTIEILKSVNVYLLFHETFSFQFGVYCLTISSFLAVLVIVSLNEICDEINYTIVNIFLEKKKMY